MARATKRDCKRAAKFAVGKQVRRDDWTRLIWGAPTYAYGEVVAVRRAPDVDGRDAGEFEVRWKAHSFHPAPAGWTPPSVVGGAELRFDAGERG